MAGPVPVPFYPATYLRPQDGPTGATTDAFPDAELRSADETGSGVKILEFVTLVVTGFVACAEFGSYAFVHPVIRRLPAHPHLQVEQGLLLTFGRVMPVGMTLCVVLALASTIVFNVPINAATGKWDADNPPPDWKDTRNKWEFFQTLRSWLLLIGFVLVCAGAAGG